MEQIPPAFWMVIISFLSFGLFMILIYIALTFKEVRELVKESTLTVREARFITAEAKVIVKEAKLIVDNIRKTTSDLSSSVKRIKTGVIDPVTSVGSVISNLVGGRK